MTFAGYTEKLPVHKGDVVVIPAGTVVRSYNPSKPQYTTKRKQTVRVHHTLNGMSMNPGFCKRKDIEYACQGKGIDLNQHYFEWEYLLLEADEYQEKEERSAALRRYYDYSIPVSNPSICWAGAGGYWCEVDLNDLALAG